MPVEKSERTAIHLTIIAMFIVLLSGAYSLFARVGVERLDLTGSLFFIFTLGISTLSLVLAFRDARYATALAAVALLLSTIIFGSCILGWRILGVTC